MKLSKTYEVSCCQIAPLKIRGARGVMEITPCVPLTLRGTLKERILASRGMLNEIRELE